MSERRVLNNADHLQIIRGTFKARDTDVNASGDFPATMGGGAQGAANTGTTFTLLYLNPAYMSQIRIAAAAAVNGTGAGRTLTVGLYPVGTPSGAINVFNPNVGTVVPGTTIAFASGDLVAGAKLAEVVNADIACPTAGFYVPGVNSPGALTANSLVMFPIRVEYLPV